MELATLINAVRHGLKQGQFTEDQWKAIMWLSDNMTVQQKETFSSLWRTQNTASKIAMPLIKEFEGCSLTAYPDPETGNEPWTIGWGTTVYDNGQKVKRGDKITQQVADDLLLKRLEKDELFLSKRIPVWNVLTVNQRAALISFTYNCGPYWFGSQGFNSITKVISEKDFSRVPEVLMLYVNPGGPTEVGLRRRRKAEGDLFKR
jgi:lysozyme